MTWHCLMKALFCTSCLACLLSALCPSYIKLFDWRFVFCLLELVSCWYIPCILQGFINLLFVWACLLMLSVTAPCCSSRSKSTENLEMKFTAPLPRSVNNWPIIYRKRCKMLKVSIFKFTINLREQFYQISDIWKVWKSILL